MKLIVTQKYINEIKQEIISHERELEEMMSEEAFFVNMGILQEANPSNS
jgi:hypothetical protein